MDSPSFKPLPHEEIEWNRYSAYFLALPLVQQAFQTVAGILSPTVIVDLGAGCGGFGLIAAQVWPKARRIAVEIRASELPHLRRHYHEVILDDALSPAVQRRIRGLGADLVLSNPPFELTAEFQDLAGTSIDSLWFLRATQNDALAAYDRLARPPSLELQIGGRPHLRRLGTRSPSGQKRHGDNVGHRWDLYLGADGKVSKFGRRPSRAAAAATLEALRRQPPLATWWPRLPLPRLPATLLKWTQRPGTEHVPPDPLPDYLVERLPLIADIHPRLRGGR